MVRSIVQKIDHWIHAERDSWQSRFLLTDRLFFRKPTDEEADWPPYSRDRPQYYILNAQENGLGKGPHTTYCAFWNDFLPKLKGVPGPCQNSSTYLTSLERPLLFSCDSHDSLVNCPLASFLSQEFSSLQRRTKEDLKMHFVLDIFLSVYPFSDRYYIYLSLFRGSGVTAVPLAKTHRCIPHSVVGSFRQRHLFGNAKTSGHLQPVNYLVHSVNSRVIDTSWLGDFESQAIHFPNIRSSTVPRSLSPFHTCH